MTSKTELCGPTIKLRLTIAYDGTAYAGWQVQKVGLGVQQKVEEALNRIFPDAGRLHSSSRTDTGVHALGMVAHVEVPRGQLKMPSAKIPLALNAHLPEDVRVLRATRCPAGFHARFDASGKQYRYLVWNARTMNPLLRQQAWHVPRPLNFQIMRSAARTLIGRHDFKSFSTNPNYKVSSTVRNLTRCDLKRSGSLLTFVIEGDGFLYRMCRGIVGTLVQVGLGRFTIADLKRMLKHGDRRLGGMTASAHGLVLWKVFYRRKASSDLRTPAHSQRPLAPGEKCGLARKRRASRTSASQPSKLSQHQPNRLEHRPGRA